LGAGLCLAAVSLCASGALADDDGFGSWTGLYGGAQVGYGWGDSNGAIEGEVEKVFERKEHVTTSSTPMGNIARDGALDDEYSTSNEGWLGGVHVGGNLQFHAIVFGVEGDYDWSSVSGDTTIDVKVRETETVPVYDTPTPTANIRSEIDGIASIRGRLGFATPQWLIYGTAGWAWADASVSVADTNPMVAEFPDVPFTHGSFTASEYLNGYVYGGGVEYMITRQLSLRVEALHYDLGSLSYAFNAEEAGVEETNNIEEAEGEQDFELTQVRAALSFHFN
jgi:outer membrane immunogenic protein